MEHTIIRRYPEKYGAVITRKFSSECNLFNISHQLKIEISFKNRKFAWHRI